MKERKTFSDGNTLGKIRIDNLISFLNKVLNPFADYWKIYPYIVKVARLVFILRVFSSHT